MNVWVYYLYWSNKYPVGPDDPVCRVATIKRNQTEIVKQQIPGTPEEDKEWILKVVPDHCIYNVALNMRQLWLKCLIQHSFVESNYELKSLLWFHLQLSKLCIQVYEKEVLARFCPKSCKWGMLDLGFSKSIIAWSRSFGVSWRHISKGC